MMKIFYTIPFYLVFGVAYAGELNYNFKNPAFSGIGYSAHVLSIEQLQFNRQKDIEDAARAEANRIERELENSTLNKFLKNVESRIYATLSKQMVDNMFAACEDETGATCPTSGTTEIEDNIIVWEKDITTGNITLTVTQSDGSVTEVTVPGAGEFAF